MTGCELASGGNATRLQTFSDREPEYASLAFARFHDDIANMRVLFKVRSP